MEVKRQLAIVACATCLAVLPTTWTRPARDAWRLALRPGCQTVDTVRDGTRRLLVSAGDRQTLSGEVRRLDARVAELALENHRLRDMLLAAQISSAGSERAAEPLLAAGLVTARVLGSQSRAYTADKLLVDVGAEVEAAEDALVLAQADGKMAAIDLGSEACLRPGVLALEGSVVWGKLRDVGQQTSLVRHVTEDGYRDLVLIAPPGDDLAQSPAQGVWQGDGAPLARIAQVDASRPISVGDRVYSAAVLGAVAAPVACGEIVRVQRTAQGPHWEIWARPLTPPGVPTELSIVRVRANPHRVASAENQ